MPDRDSVLSLLAEKRPDLFRDLAGIDPNRFGPDRRYGWDVMQPPSSDGQLDPLEMINQAAAGFLEGFTALPSGVDEPQSESEYIARSMGHLFGFVGLVPGLGNLGAVTAKGVGAGAKALGLSRVFAKIGGMKFADTVFRESALGLGITAGAKRFRSAPLLVADIAVESLRKLKPVESGLSYLSATRFGQTVSHVGESALHLGVASAVSESNWLIFDEKPLQESVKDAFVAAAYGGVLGGAFAAIPGSVWRIKGFQEPSTKNTMLRFIAGSLTQGLPATLAGEPTASLVYNYALGGIFGVHTPSSETFHAAKWFSKIENPMIRTAALAPFRDAIRNNTPLAQVKDVAGFMALPENVRSRVLQMHETMDKPDVAMSAFAWILEQFNTRNNSLDWQALMRLTPEELSARMSRPLDVKPGDKVVVEEYLDPETGQPKAPIAEVLQIYSATGGIKVKMPNGNNETYGFYRLRKATEILPGKETAKEDVAGREREDFDPISTVAGRATFMDLSARRGGKTQADVEKVEDEFLDVMRRADADPELPIRAELEKMIPKYAVEDEPLANNLVQMFYEKKWGVRRQIGHFDAVKNELVLDAKVNDIVWDADNNRINIVGSKEYLDDLLTVSWVSNRFLPGRFSVRDLLNYPITIETLGTMGRSAYKQGYVPFTGRADKPELKFIRIDLPKDRTLDEEWARIDKTLTEVDPSWPSYRDAMMKRDTRFYGDRGEEISKVSFITQVRNLERVVWGRNDTSGDLLRRMYRDTEPPSLPKDVRELSAFYPEIPVTPMVMERWGRKGYIEGTRKEAPDDEYFASEWTKEGWAPAPVRTTLTRLPREWFQQETGEDVTGEQRWLIFHAERERLVKTLPPPAEGTHMADWIQELNPLAAERMLSRIARDTEIKRFNTTMADRNKRLQLLDHRFFGLDRQVGSPEDRAVLDNVNVILIQDPYLNALDGGGSRVLKEASDGAAWVPRRLMKVINRVVGHSETDGFSKVFVRHKSPEYGLGLYKPLLQPMSGELEGMTRVLGENIILMPLTSAKALGERQVYSMHFYRGKPIFFDLDGNMVERPVTYKLNPEDIGWALGVKDPRVKGRIDLSKSVLSYANRFQMGTPAYEAWRELIDKAGAGTEEANKVFAEYVASPTPENLAKLDPHWRGINKRQLLAQLNVDDNLKGRYVREVMLKDPRDSQEWLVEGEETLEWDGRLAEAYGDLRRVYIAEGDPLKLMDKTTKGLIDELIKRHTLSGLTRPMISGNKAFVGLFDPLEVRKFRLKERGDDPAAAADKVYLNDGLKDMPIYGYETDGTRRWMTLKEQVQVLKNLELKKPVKWEDLTARINDEVMTPVVERDPMDDATGYVTLRVGGWTGRPGTGVILAPEHFKRLSGMDGDGDTVNLYFGLAKAIREWAGIEGRDYYDRLQKKVPKGEQAWYSNDNPGLIAGSHKVKSASLDPLAMMLMGLEVSRGRGGLMGIHSAMKTSVTGLLDNLTGKGVYVSPVYDYSRSWLTGNTVTFVPRPDKDETLQFLSHGSHVFVDVAKKGNLLPSMETVEAMNLAAAFERIIIRERVRGKWVERTIDLSRAFNADHTKFTLSGDAAEQLYDFIGSMMWRTDIGMAREANRKMYRTNRLQRRPWEFKEVVDAADRYPYDRLDTLYGTVAGYLRGMKYNDGILPRIMPYWKYFLENASNYDTFISKLTRSRRLFPFLGVENVTPNWMGMMSRAAIVREQYRPDLAYKYNWATPDGLRMYARYKTDEMVDRLVDFYKITREEAYQRDLGKDKKAELTAMASYMSPLDYLSHLDREIARTYGMTRRFTEAQMNRMAMVREGTSVTERFNAIRSATDSELKKIFTVMHRGMTESQRTMVLRGYVEQVEDFISTRFRDIAGLHEMYRVYHKVKMDPIIARRMITAISEMKQQYDMYATEKRYEKKLGMLAAKHKWTQERYETELTKLEERNEEMHRRHGTPDAVQARMERLIRRMSFQLPKVNKDRSVDLTEKDLKEFGWTVFASSLDPHIGKTRVSKRLDEIVPPDITRRFMELNRNLFTKFAQRSPGTKNLADEWRKEFLEEHPGVQAFDDQFTTYHTVTNVLFDRKLSALPDNYQLMAKEVADILKSYPKLGLRDPQAAWDLIQNLTGKASPSMLTIHDLKGLRDRLVGWKIGPGLLRWFRFGSPDQWRKVEEMYENGRAPGFLDHFFFITTTADRLRIKDLFTIDHRLFDDEGKLSDQAVALPYAQEGRIHYVYTNAKEPMTTLHRLIDDLKMLSTFPEQVDQMDITAVERTMNTLIGLRDEKNQDQFRTIFDLAVRRREMLGSKRELDELKARTSTESDEYQKKLSDFNVYKVRHLDASGKYKEIEHQVFHLLDGTTLTGEKAVARMEEALDSLLGDYGFTFKIAMTPENAKQFFTVKNGVVDHRAMFTKLSSLIRQGILTKQVPADVARAMELFNEMHLEARRKEGTLEVPVMADVESMNFGKMKDFKEHLNQVLPGYGDPFTSAAEARVWLSYFQRQLHNPESEVEVKMDDREMRMIARRAIEAAHIVAGKDALTVKEVSHRANQANRYFGYSLDAEHGAQSDPRWIVTGQLHHSQYELDKMLSAGKIGKYEYLYHTAGDEMTYRNTGEVLGYFPHLNFGRGNIDEAMRQQLDLILNDNTTDHAQKEMALNQLSEMKARLMGWDAGTNVTADAEVMRPLEPGRIERTLNLTAHKSPNQYHREYNLDGYARDLEAVSEYFRRMNRATYQRISLMLARNAIAAFEERSPMGEFTKQWADFFRVYARNALGGPSLFTDELLSDTKTKLKSTPTYWMSDHFWGPSVLKIHKVWMMLNGSDLVTDIDRARFKLVNGRDMTKAEETAVKREKYKAATEPTEENMMRAYKMLGSFSMWEGRYEMAALLFNVKTAVTNVLGGTVNDWVYNGARHMVAARQFSTWKRVSPRNPDTGEPIWKDMNDVYKAFFTQGVVEEFITREANLYHEKPARWDEFAEALAGKIVKDVKFSRKGLLELAKEYGITEAVVNKSGVFMQKTERQLRMNTFLAAYLAARSQMEPMPLEWNNPWLIAQGKRAIAAAQFLYGAETRPIWAATNVGKVYSRFKLWAWSSVKYRRLVMEEARAGGYAAGTQEFQRLQRMVTADLFVMALATLLPYTILDYGLPAPLSYFQNLADWLFNDEKERERAFFVQSTGIPTAVAPLNELMPPIARVGKGLYDIPDTFSALVGGQIERLGEYTTMSILPFGRMSKDVLRSMTNPGMAFDIMTGIPLKRLGQVQTKLQRRKRHGPPYYPVSD